MNVFWTDSAIEQLENIFNFYRDKANIKVAHQIVNRIVDKSILLENQPELGQREELLRERNNDYRYLVESNHKIIYGLKNHPLILQQFLIAGKIL